MRDKLIKLEDQSCANGSSTCLDTIKIYVKFYFNTIRVVLKKITYLQT